MKTAKLFPILVVISSLFVANPAFASFDKTTGSLQVLQITALSDGGFYVKFNADVCHSVSTGGDRTTAQVGPGWVTGGLTATKEGIAQMHKTLLAAKLAGSNVVAYADNGGHFCHLGAVKID